MAKKKFDYFNYFKGISDIICEAAEYLYSVVCNFDANQLKEKIDDMHEIEHRADCLKHEMTKLLSHEFITPIEREDIVSLAQSLDNIVDNMEDVLLRIYMFNVTKLIDGVEEYCEVIVRCARALNDVLAEFKNFKHSQSIREGIVAINNFESDGDKLLFASVRSLAVANDSEKELFVWTDIYEHLEECLDACEDVVDIIEEVIMKNS